MFESDPHVDLRHHDIVAWKLAFRITGPLLRESTSIGPLMSNSKHEQANDLKVELLLIYDACKVTHFAMMLAKWMTLTPKSIDGDSDRNPYIPDGIRVKYKNY